MSIITYEQRVEKIKKPGDEDTQLRLAKEYVKRLRTKAKKQETLKDKIHVLDKIKKAEAVLRKLRLNIFSIQERLEKEKIEVE